MVFKHIFYVSSSEQLVDDLGKKTLVGLKVILLWSGSQNFQLPCGCYVTSNRELYKSSADTILFDWKQLLVNENRSIPGIKRPGQTWIWYNREPPSTSFVDLDIDPYWLKSIENLFDCWISYRNDSDFVHHRFDIVPSSSSISSSSLANSKKQKRRKMSLTNKKRNVAWFVSHCNAESGRDDFAKQLAKFIDIDIYGDCGAFKCSKINPDLCYQMVEDDYKFYLSFENSICRDYVTERLSNVLKYNIVPIVFGGFNYSSLLPPDSFINAFDFDSPSKLSDYLKLVANNQTAYNQYFNWKSKYQVVEKPFNSVLCDICDSMKVQLHDEPICHHDNNKTLTNWYFNEANCFQWDPNMKLIPVDYKL
ncbi:alpha-(1,3)-fucosyltransferase C-like [Panonychus citri]|uniref:alpha-(1,3)-fucosyltransferase C-like n=1 Tax=Panonychus citri TaxID=50023 RepID=UPI002308096B|nr:alpha-(1,3)-fucosyltransferase C-like [Panonychus citri]